VEFTHADEIRFPYVDAHTLHTAGEASPQEDDDRAGGDVPGMVERLRGRPCSRRWRFVRFGWRAGAAAPRMLGQVTRTAKYAGAATLVLLLLTACGDDGLPEGVASGTGTPGERPTITRDAERTAEPTRTAAEPTREEAEPTREEATREEATREEPTSESGPTGEPTRGDESNEPSATGERTVIVERTVERTVTESAQAPEPTGTVVAGEETVPPEDTDGVPPWAWLLLIVPIAGAGFAIWALQRRNTRQAWESGLEAAAGEATWVVRRVIPDLARAPGPQQRALAWGGAAGRVGDLEERLAGLAATAPEPQAAARAQDLGDAVRQAHGRLDQMIVAADPATLSDQLWAVARDLDDAVAAALPPAPATATAPGAPGPT
jgi:hypothetical protein